MIWHRDMADRALDNDDAEAIENIHLNGETVTITVAPRDDLYDREIALASDGP